MNKINFYLLFALIAINGFPTDEDKSVCVYSSEECVARILETRINAEKPNLRNWHDIMIECAKDIDKMGQKELEMTFTRPVYRMNMYYSLLDTINEKDVEEAKAANAGTNTLGRCWQLLGKSSRCIPSIHLYKHDFASAWRETDFESGSLDMGVDTDSAVRRFYWFIAQAYAKDIWEDWYSCWKNETQKETSRKFVVAKLMSDFTSLEAFLLPYMSEALKGDDSLLSIVKNCNCHPDPNNSDFSFINNKGDYLLWWEANKDSYLRTLSADDGLEKAKQNAEKSIKFLKTNPKEPELLQVWAVEIADYYRKPISLREKDYWYYRIGDEPIEDWGDYYKALEKSYSD